MTSEIGKALGDVLASARYDEESVRELVRQDGLDFGRGLAALRLRPSADERLSRLVRLFLAADVLTAPSAAAAVAPLTLEALVAAGLIEHRDDGVHSLVRLDPIEQLIVASDPQVPQRRFSRDHVIAPGPASRALAAVTIRSQVGSALDLCCGSGVQALLAARHAGNVVATTSIRARCSWHRWAGLSGLENSNGGREICSSPFATSASSSSSRTRPSSSLPHATSRSGTAGAAVTSSRTWSLRESRRAWRTGASATRSARGSAATGSTGRRHRAGGSKAAAAMRRSSTSTVKDRSLTQSVGPPSTPRRGPRRLPRPQSGSTTTGSSASSELRPASSCFAGEPVANWVQCEELVSARPDSGDHLARIFAGHDALERIAGDGGLLSLPLALGPGVRLVERRVAGGHLERARLTADAGMQLPARVTPPPAAAALLELNGIRTLAEAGARAGVAPGVLEAALPSVRRLVERGYLSGEKLGARVKPATSSLSIPRREGALA